MKPDIIKDWKKYSFEFLSIFVAVVAAFALNNWNENKNNRKAEHRILTEIYNGLEKDVKDLNENERGHKQGIEAIHYFKRMIANNPVSKDSFMQYYFMLTRDFISIQNTSGYQTLKSKGLELIENDSLRSGIISLYEYDYNTLRKLEEEYSELQFQDNYFKEINSAIADNFQFNNDKILTGITLPLKMSKEKENTVLSYFWKMQVNRKFILQYYIDVQDNVNKVKSAIDNEIKL